MGDLIRNAWSHWLGQFIVSMSITIPLVVIVTAGRIYIEYRERKGKR